MRLRLAVAAVWCLAGGAAHGQDVHFNGLLDLNAVVPDNNLSNLDGGLGKTRWGDPHGDAIRPELGAMVLRGAVDITPELLLVSEISYNSQQKTAVDILDGYLRWRPVSTTRWRWAVKAGAFFVPVSLENTGVGWSSEWTVTPSAINSWIGDELRTIGGEGTLEWRGDVDHLQATLALFGWNQPAGVAIAQRGWTFNDRPLGLLNQLRLPNSATGPQYVSEFKQIDGSPGYYAGLSWDRPDLGRVALLRYDNEANPAIERDGVFAWRTKFWSLGVSTELAGLVVLAQAMLGSTQITPSPSFSSNTDFYAAYLLAGYEIGQWRYALRVDRFGTTEHQPGPSMSERGAALTAAVTYSPREYLHIIGEVLGIDYWQPQSVVVNGGSARRLDAQAQLTLRVTF